MQNVIRLAILLTIVSCASTPMESTQDSSVTYQKDMRLRVDGVKMEGGVYVLGRKGSYTIRADMYRKAVIFKVTSCHREWVYHDPGSSIDFIYQPMKGIEDERLCPLELGGFDLKGQHTWAYIDFVDAEEVLKAELSCNGHYANFSGVSICQSRTGLIQRITFNEPVYSYGVDRCNVAATEDKKIFELKATKGKCVYLFMNEKGERHRFTTIGYDDVLLRE